MKKGKELVSWREEYIGDLIDGINRSTNLLSGFTVDRDHAKVLCELGYENYHSSKRLRRESNNGKSKTV